MSEWAGCRFIDSLSFPWLNSHSFIGSIGSPERAIKIVIILFVNVNVFECFFVEKQLFYWIIQLLNKHIFNLILSCSSVVWTGKCISPSHQGIKKNFTFWKEKFSFGKKSFHGNRDVTLMVSLRRGLVSLILDGEGTAK